MNSSERGRPGPVLAQQPRARAAQQDAERDHDEDGVVELAGDRDEVRHDVDRRRHVDDHPTSSALRHQSTRGSVSRRLKSTTQSGTRRTRARASAWPADQHQHRVSYTAPTYDAASSDHRGRSALERDTVPGVGLEPTSPRRTMAFEAIAYANSATRAGRSDGRAEQAAWRGWTWLGPGAVGSSRTSTSTFHCCWKPRIANATSSSCTGTRISVSRPRRSRSSVGLAEAGLVAIEPGRAGDRRDHGEQHRQPGGDRQHAAVPAATKKAIRT